MDKTMPQQVHLKTSVMYAGTPLKGLWLMDESILEQGQGEELNAITRSKVTKGEGCNGYTFKVL